MLYMTNENILKSKLKKQEISEQKTKNNEIHETILSITDDKFSISKYIHDLNHSTKVTKWYPCVDTLKVFVLDKKKKL